MSSRLAQTPKAAEQVKHLLVVVQLVAELTGKRQNDLVVYQVPSLSLKTPRTRDRTWFRFSLDLAGGVHKFRRRLNDP